MPLSLRPCSPDDHPALYRLIGQARGNLFQLRDFIPSPDQFVGALWQNTLSVYVGGEHPQDVSFAARISDVDYSSRRADLGLMLAPNVPLDQSRLCTTGYLEHFFYNSPIAKLSIYALPDDYVAIQDVLGDRLADEGALLNHSYHHGEYVDVKVGAVFRKDFAGDVP